MSVPLNHQSPTIMMVAVLLIVSCMGEGVRWPTPVRWMTPWEVTEQPMKPTNCSSGQCSAKAFTDLSVTCRERRTRRWASHAALHSTQYSRPSHPKEDSSDNRPSNANDNYWFTGEITFGIFSNAVSNTMEPSISKHCHKTNKYRQKHYTAAQLWFQFLFDTQQDVH